MEDSSLWGIERARNRKDARVQLKNGGLTITQRNDLQMRFDYGLGPDWAWTTTREFHKFINDLPLEDQISIRKYRRRLKNRMYRRTHMEKKRAEKAAASGNSAS